MVHVDLVGPFLPDMHRFTYLMVFIDEATRHKCIFGLRTKDEVYKPLQPHQEGMMLKGVNVEYIRRDGAGELGRSSKFRKELIALSLKWESSPPYTHQQQGLIERAIREIVEGGRAQLARAYLGNEFWVWACRDFTAKSNYLPHQALGGDSPYERIHPGRKPRYQALRKFGQTAYVHVDKSRQGEFSRGKLNTMRPRSERGILVGHDMGISAYIVFLPRIKKVVTSSAVVFDDFPIEVPFQSERPAHWTSPAPGVDDTTPVVTEDSEFASETKDSPEGHLTQGKEYHSVFDGRDIPRSPAITSDNREENEKQEDVQQIEHPQPIKSNSVCRDQLLDIFGYEDDVNNFVCCMLADSGMTVEKAMNSKGADSWTKAIKAEETGLERKGVLSTEKCPPPR